MHHFVGERGGVSSTSNGFCGAAAVAGLVRRRIVAVVGGASAIAPNVAQPEKVPCLVGQGFAQGVHTASGVGCVHATYGGIIQGYARRGVGFAAT